MSFRKGKTNDWINNFENNFDVKMEKKKVIIKKIYNSVNRVCVKKLSNYIDNVKKKRLDSIEDISKSDSSS